MTSRFKIFLGSTSKAIADREEKRVKKAQKFEYLENLKGFLDEIKGIIW